MAAAPAGVEVPTPINVDAVDPADSGRANGRLDDVLAFLMENSGKQPEASLPLMNFGKGSVVRLDDTL